MGFHIAQSNVTKNWKNQPQLKRFLWKQQQKLNHFCVSITMLLH